MKCCLFLAPLAFSMAVSAHAGTINPATDITYIGSFTVPTAATGGYNGNGLFYRFGKGLAYNPNGNGGKGSLFLSDGHLDQGLNDDLVAEISIPALVATTNPASMNTAAVLQSAHAITTAGSGNGADTQGGLLYFPRQGSQSTDKLYWGMYTYYTPTGSEYTLGMSELTLGTPNPRGPWTVPLTTGAMRTGQYMVRADQTWANSYTGGRSLLTGRQREAGGQGGSKGPTLYAVQPWQSDTPGTPVGGSLSSMALMEYPSGVGTPPYSVWPNWQPKDTFAGAAWVSSAGNTAILLAGRKAHYGDGSTEASGNLYCYGSGPAYGGTCNDPCDSSKGYHGYPYTAQWYWVDPATLANIAQGKQAASNTVLPYSSWTPAAATRVDQSSCTLGYGAITYDDVHGIIYAVELDAGPGTTPVIHAFQVSSTSTGGSGSGSSASPLLPPTNVKAGP